MKTIFLKISHVWNLSKGYLLSVVPEKPFFFVSGFFSQTFTKHKTVEEWGGHFFNSSLLLPPTSQTVRHQPGIYCTELTSAHRYQADWKRDPFVSGRKSLIAKLRTLWIGPYFHTDYLKVITFQYYFKISNCQT